MKSSSYIKHIAKTNILKKGQRTWLSIISVLLSTAIIFTSLTLFINVFSFSKKINYDEIGYYHFAAYVEDEVTPSTRYDLTLDYGTNLYGKTDAFTYTWRTLELENDKLLPFHLISGSIPKFVTNSTIFLLSTCWNALRAGILREVANARLNVNTP